MSKIIQSFYSRICSEEYKFVHNCFYCLSILYANESNIDIDLYTDYEFKELMDKAPYKNMNVIFENHNEYAKIDRLLFAWPKFVALDMTPRDTVHIDGDVFLKDETCKQLFIMDEYDCLTQHLEHRNDNPNIYAAYGETYLSIESLNFPDFIDKRIPESMPNNGVLCVKNETLWEKYRDTYWLMLQQCPANSINPIGWCVPDIIFEQYFLLQICEKDGYKIGYAIKGKNEDEAMEYAIQHKYQHICHEKRMRLPQCLNLIKKKSPICYEMIKSNWSDKYPQYFEEIS